VVHLNTGTATPHSSSAPTGLTPTQVRHAYGFDQISGNGSGQTIAIVDAFDDPSIQSDLHAFDLQFGLADPVLTKVNQTGGTSLPTPNAGWAGEIALDVEWDHAIAPGATILLVEANSDSLTDLFSAVRFAAAQTGVAAVSMSWGTNEFSGETSFDSTFVTPAGHSGVVFVGASGDSGAPIEYPTASPNVLSVGGTTLHVDAQGNYQGETAWSGSGGGISRFESQPSYQKGVVTQSMTQRTGPDVAYDADPNTGFSVYQTYGNSSSKPWVQYGGTSAGAPQWSALVALADQSRAAAKEPALTTASLLTQLYQLPSADIHDITSGSSGSGSRRNSATVGYDLVTGRGSPVANRMIADLVSLTPPTTPPVSPPVSQPPVSPPPVSPPPTSPPPSQGSTATSTRLTAGPVMYHWGYATVNLTLTVSPSSGSVLPGGLVDIYANGRLLGAATLHVVNGVETASVTLLVFRPGTFTLSAGYVGTSAFTASTSSPVSIIV
jgi:subtilase family serine protease